MNPPLISDLSDPATLSAFLSAIEEDALSAQHHGQLKIIHTLKLGLRLVWLRDNGHEKLLANILNTGLPGCSRRTLFHIIKLGDHFFTHCLEPSEAPALIGMSSSQLSTDTSETSVLFREYIGDLSLTDLYIRCGALRGRWTPTPGEDNNPPPGYHPRKDTGVPEIVRTSIRQWSGVRTQLRTLVAGETWQYLPDTDRDELYVQVSELKEKLALARAASRTNSLTRPNP